MVSLPAGTRVHPMRYFSVIGLHPAYALVVLAAIAALGLVTVWLDAGELDSGLGMILFVQMFLASSGFAVRARRGHFDPVLTVASDRTSVVIFHWIASILPGLLAWILLAAAGWLLESPVAQSAMAGKRAAALVIVSALAWAAGVMLPRGAAGVLWIGVLLALLLSRAELLPLTMAPGASVGALAQQAAMLVLCPFLLMGSQPAVSPAAIWAAILIAGVLLLSVLRGVTALDVYLVDRA
jgi:hypothetical protein